MTSMSIQNLADPPSTDQPWTATPYNPSSGSESDIDSDEVLLQDPLLFPGGEVAISIVVSEQEQVEINAFVRIHADAEL